MINYDNILFVAILQNILFIAFGSLDIIYFSGFVSFAVL